jgi:hypothetical protein
MSTTSFSNDPETASGGNDSGDAKAQAQQAAGTAKDEGKRVAGVAKDEASRVTGEAKAQLRSLLEDTTSQVEEQSRAQKAKLADTVRAFGQDLDSMTSQGNGSDGLAGQVVHQVADQARTLAGHLDDREPRDLLEDVRSFARRRPGAFLLGAMAAGVVVGRLTRGAKAAEDDSSTPSPSTSTSERAPEPVTVGTLPSAQADHGATVGGPADAGITAGAPAETDLGAKGVEISESGIVGPSGGRV